MRRLEGMTWSHPRGFDPMVACSRLWKERTGIHIAWDKRSLQDFESYPVEELARTYDLIVIDHPHVGEITEQNCLQALDLPGREAANEALAQASVGGSYESYYWQGRQWALPIDAAAQVQAWRPDLLANPAAEWDEVVELAKAGRVMIPLRPPHSLMVFYTLAANRGTPCRADGPGALIAPAEGAEVYDLIADLVRHVPEECFAMDPIAVSETMAEAESRIACAPLIYGYVNYGIEGFRPQRLAFADIPTVGGGPPAGSALGGTGIAVSAYSDVIEAAVDFAYWIASGAVQSGPFAVAGGQPGHVDGWEDARVNAATRGFYRNTRRTLDLAWTRPRHQGYMPFQLAASERLHAGLRGGEPGHAVVADINRQFTATFG